MGARIAAHFANAGVPCILLDMVPADAAQSSDKSARNKIVAAGLDAAIKSKPAAFYEKGLERLITIGNFDDDMKLIAEADWIIEAVAENLEIKRALLKKVEAARKPGSVVTTNTSGLPVASIAQVGLDVMVSVVKNFSKSVKDERADLKLPEFLDKMIERKLLGDKTKAGFYKKTKGPQGLSEDRLAIDVKTLEYHPAQKPKFATLEMAKHIEDMGERLRTILGPDASKDTRHKAARFTWTNLSKLWTYSANRIPQAADTVVDITASMRNRFNWEVGPLELWDLAGVEATVVRMKSEGKPVAANVEKLLASAAKSWYKDDPPAPSGRAYFDLRTGTYKPVEVP